MEEILLLAVHQLEANAYGVRIKSRVEELLEKPVSVGAVYVPLDRLARRGFLKTWQGDPSPERGGRSKKYYKLTQAGISILKETKKLNDLLWTNVSV
jgi:DNA-binding PadR family transcriptional regulator